MQVKGYGAGNAVLFLLSRSNFVLGIKRITNAAHRKFFAIGVEPGIKANSGRQNTGSHDLLCGKIDVQYQGRERVCS
jgi:hypothetical protein